MNRNKILGEESDEELDEDVDTDSKQEGNSRKTFVPQYVNIRRQRPSTEEPPSTSKYQEIRRSTTESNGDESNETTSK